MSCPCCPQTCGTHIYIYIRSLTSLAIDKKNFGNCRLPRMLHKSQPPDTLAFAVSVFIEDPSNHCSVLLGWACSTQDSVIDKPEEVSKTDVARSEGLVSKLTLNY